MAKEVFPAIMRIESCLTVLIKILRTNFETYLAKIQKAIKTRTAIMKLGSLRIKLSPHPWSFSINL